MSSSIENASKEEVRSVIRYLHSENISAAEIHRKLKKTYDDKVIDESTVRRWCKRFSAGQSSGTANKRSGRPSVITDDLIQSVQRFVNSDKRRTLDDIHDEYPDVSRTILHEIVTKNLGYRKICARWVPHHLTDEHKAKRLAAAAAFFDQLQIEETNSTQE